MTPEKLAKLIRQRLEAKDMSTADLARELAGKCAVQTVYNALAGKPIRTDTLLAIMEQVGLEIGDKGA